MSQIYFFQPVNITNRVNCNRIIIINVTFFMSTLITYSNIAIIYMQELSAYRTFNLHIVGVIIAGVSWSMFKRSKSIKTGSLF